MRDKDFDKEAFEAGVDMAVHRFMTHNFSNWRWDVQFQEMIAKGIEQAVYRFLKEQPVEIPDAVA